jgi:hypothetical protein
MVMVGAVPNGRYGEHYELYPCEARQDHRGSGRVERTHPRSVANGADPYDWTGKTEFQPVFEASEVAASLAVDSRRDSVLGGVVRDWKLFEAWWQSGRALRDLSKVFFMSGVLVFLAHVSALGWILVWDGTARLMGAQ